MDYFCSAYWISENGYQTLKPKNELCSPVIAAVDPFGANTSNNQGPQAGKFGKTPNAKSHFSQQAAWDAIILV